MKRALILIAFAACRSDAPQYYTLVAPAVDEPPAEIALQLDVLPVDVPPDVDRVQMVVRRGAGEVTPVDTRAWIAPLPLELRRALANALVHALAARDITGLSPTDGVPTVRVKVAVQRFESELDVRARVDAAWSVREAGGAAALTCTTRVTEPARSGYSGLAEAHQRAVAKLAADIAAGVRALRAGAPACPH